MDIASDYDLLATSSDSEDPDYDQSRKNPNIISSMDKVAYRMRHDENGVIWHGIVDPKRPDSPPVEWPEYPDRLIQDDHPYGRDPVYNKYVSLDGEDGCLSSDDSSAGCGDKVDDNEEEPMSDDDLKISEKPLVSEKIKMTEMMEADNLMDNEQMPEYPGLYPGDHGAHYGDEDVYHRQSLWKEENWKLPDLQQYQLQNNEELPQLDLEW